MPYPAGVIPWNIKEFSNVHDNFVQPLAENQSFDLILNDPAFQDLDPMDQYRKCTENLQWIIQSALDAKMKIRAMGSGWSLSKVAVANDAIINTKKLRHKFTMSNENFLPEVLENGVNPDNYRFLQCGNTIIGINEYLEQQCKPAKSLKASGGSNGQTIVGAFSTGTHGAALFYGSLSEMIHGIHLISDPDKHYYLERSSNRLTSSRFHDKLGATAIPDDELFNAVLVSFGSFGIIHGVLIEVEDKFLLEQKRERIPFDEAVEKAICLGELSGIEKHLKYPLADKERLLYHFELALNPHDFAYGDSKKGIYMRAMYKTVYREGYKPIDVQGEGYTYGDDTLGLMQAVLDKIQTRFGKMNNVLIPKIVNSLFDLAYDRPEEAVGTIGETFRNTIFRGQLFSAAIGLDIKDVKKVIDHCLNINKVHKLAGIFAFRFVKGSKATLGFTRWENTCVLELDGVDAKINYLFLESVINCMESNNIKYTLHWGKINGVLNEERLIWMYGQDKLISWKRQRSRVMSKEVQQLFNNSFMEQCGLDRYEAYHQVQV